MPDTMTYPSPTLVAEIAEILVESYVNTEPLWDMDVDRIIGLNVIRPVDVDYEYFTWQDEYGWMVTSGYVDPAGGSSSCLDVAPDADAEKVAAQILAVLSSKVDIFRPIPN